MAYKYFGGYALNSTTLEFEASLGNVSVVTSPVRTGTYAGRIHLTGSIVTSYWRKQFLVTAVSTGKWYKRICVNIQTLPNGQTVLLALTNSTAPATANAFCRAIAMTSTGALKLLDNTGAQVGSTTSALSAGVWHTIDLLVDYTTPKAEVRVDGSVVITDNTFTNTSTISQAVWGVDIFATAPAVSTCDLIFDDYALADDSGTNHTGYIDSRECYACLRPAGAAATSSMNAYVIKGSSPAATIWQSINEVTPDDGTTYVTRPITTETGGSGVADRGNDVTIEDPTTKGMKAADTINAVQLHVRGGSNSASDNSSRDVFLRLKSTDGGGTPSANVLESIELHLNTNIVTPVWNTDGTSNTASPWPLPVLTSYGIDHTTKIPVGDAASNMDAWTVTGANSLSTAQMGFHSSVTSGQASNFSAISAMWAYVAYIPGPLTQTISDLLALSDNVHPVSAFVRSITDHEGLTDSAIAEVGGSTITRTLTDSFTLTDVVPRAYAAVLTDNLGLTDTGLAVTSSPDHFDMVDYLSRDITRTITDRLGLTDTVSLVAQAPGVVNIADRISFTDTVGAARNLARTINDTLGMSDTMTAVTALQVLVDAVFEIGHEQDGWRIG